MTRIAVEFSARKVCFAHVIPLVMCMKLLFLHTNAIYLQYHPSQLYKLIPHIIDIHTRAHTFRIHALWTYVLLSHVSFDKARTRAVYYGGERTKSSTEHTKTVPSIVGYLLYSKNKEWALISQISSQYTRRVFPLFYFRCFR